MMAHTRRGLTAGLAAMIAAPPALTAGVSASAADPAQPTADTALIALCTRAEAAEDRSIEAMESVDDLKLSDPLWEAAFEEARRHYGQCRVGMDEAALIPARTPEGLQAKASLALREIGLMEEDGLELVLSVLQQLAGRA